jgi:hypothetical protein
MAYLAYKDQEIEIEARIQKRQVFIQKQTAHIVVEHGYTLYFIPIFFYFYSFY